MAEFNAKEQNFIVFNSEKRLVIPFFQRKYVWKENNWNELFDNFFVKDKPSFLGSIIVQRNDIVAGSGTLDVVDGQQRLTTISILIMAIYDSIKNPRKENAKNEIFNALFSKGIYNDSYTPKLVHSKFDKEKYDTIISFEKNSEDFKNDTEGIFGCYNYFMQRLSSISDQKKEKVLSEFLEGTYLIWVVITLDKEMDEQSIFDTLNNSGVSLTASDTIKNFIFKRATDLYEKKYPNNSLKSTKAVINLYEQNWESEFIDNEESEKYWNSEITTGRIKRTKLDLFLYCFAVIKGFFSPYDNNISELTYAYKEYFANKIHTDKEIDNFLKGLKKFANKFRLNFENTTKETFYTYDEENVLPRLLHLLKVNDVTTFHPYILNVLCENENNIKMINKKLHLLEKYLIINYLNQDSSKIKNYNKFCLTIISDSKKLEEELNEIAKNITYTQLNNISNSFATYYLFWIELYRRRGRFDESSLAYIYTLEHIMPIKWREYWSDDVNKGLMDSNGNKLSLFDSIDYRDNHIKMLGNMTLLKGGLNTSISNKPFKEKIPSIKEFATLKITKDDIVDRYYSKDKKHSIKIWNENIIEERTRKLKLEINNALLY